MSTAIDYDKFIAAKSQLDSHDGFKATFMPSSLFDFQAALIEWAVYQGRGALLEDCGLGKSFQELVFAENVVRHTNGRVLILTPLGVTRQFVTEGAKFGIEVKRPRQGKLEGPGIYVTNYERLHQYDPNDFTGVVCDEASILKNFDGVTKAAVTEFMRLIRYRLLGTATPSPNDHVELGTCSEALGYLGYMDMLNRFFKNTQNTSDTARKWANHGGGAPKWRFKGHAQVPFWQWVTSWARAIRRPSDIGFSDEKFVLPALEEVEHIVTASKPSTKYLFTMPAHGLSEQRDERRRSLPERCHKAASLVANTGNPAVVWCHLNDEADLVEKLVPGAVQVSGRDSDHQKEETYAAFESGQIRVIVIKPAIGAWGLNWQHCAHMVEFAGYSFEQSYQSRRRLYRFGQKNTVRVDCVRSDGEGEVLASRQRKARQADEMFSALVKHMNGGVAIDRTRYGTTPTLVPPWL